MTDVVTGSGAECGASPTVVRFPDEHGHRHSHDHGWSGKDAALSAHMHAESRAREIVSEIHCGERHHQDTLRALLTEIGRNATEAERHFGNLRERIREEGVATRDLIRDNRTIDLATQLAETRADLRVCRGCTPAPV